MKKFILPMLACAMLLMMPCTAAMATVGEPIEVGPHPGREETSRNTITEIEYDNILNEMVQTRIDTYIPTEEDYAKAKEILDLYNEVNYLSENPIATRSGYDENKEKLRVGNLIELSLDYDEGLTNSVVAYCLLLSDGAKKDAQKNFPEYWDSGQHFMWNFMMTDKENKSIARTIANNHEWGISMIEPMLNYFDSAYNEYIADGDDEHNASGKALADTILYMPKFKYDAVCIMEESYDFFKFFFSEESIMDFWNNCYGRSYREKGYTNAVTAFNYSAFTADELVLDGENSMAENLTEGQMNSVWAWDWYSY